VVSGVVQGVVRMVGLGGRWQVGVGRLGVVVMTDGVLRHIPSGDLDSLGQD
jgi:hypothetical protein